MFKVAVVLVAFALSVGLTGASPTQAAGGPPSQECLDELSFCLDHSTSSADDRECFVEFRACRLAS